ncbi:MAG TPA: hypothetical protein VK639_20980 [Terriglobales bacterium]|nr:hypothetical protein [Terriglobales bacterium]
MERRLILGELVNGFPIFMDGTQTKLLCSQRASPSDNGASLREKVTGLIERISRGRIRFSHSQGDVETFWVIDLNRNSASVIGQVSQFRGGGSSFVPSPDFHYGSNKPTGSLQKPEFFLCDLKKENVSKFNLDGWPVGRWDERKIAIKDSNNNFILYDAVTQKVSTLLSLGQIGKFFDDRKIVDEMDIPEDPSRAGVFFVWNGRANDAYLTDTHTRWEAVESYLIKIEPPSGTLRLMSRRFKFEWSDHWDETGEFYVTVRRSRLPLRGASVAGWVGEKPSTSCRSGRETLDS